MSILSVNLGHLVPFFDFRLFKNPETQKTGLEKTYLFLVTDRSDRYLAWILVHLNLISYITMSIIFNKLQ